MNRIISKEKEREDPRRDTSKTSFQLESKSVSSVSTCNPVTTTTSLILSYRINSTKRNTRLILCRHLPAVAPRVSKHSTRQKQGSKHPTVFQAPTAQAGFQLILPGRNSILHGSQPSRSSLPVTPQAQST